MEPVIGALRDAVQIQRRAAAADGYGNTAGDWGIFITRRAAALSPTRGGELVIADRAQGQSTWDCWVRFDSETSLITPADRLIDLRAAGGVYNIVFAQDMTGRRRWLLLQLTLGKADG